MVHSQTMNFKPEWAFGLNAGVTLSSVGFLPRVPQTFLLQETGGLTARYISEKNCGVQVELNYSLRGWQEQANNVSHFNHYCRSLSYIELPVLTHFYFDIGKRARIVLNLGPQIGYNIGEKVLEKEIVAPPNGEEPTVPRYYDDDYTVQQKFDYGIAGGLGLEIRTGIGNFVLEGRYFYGLSDIFKNSRSDVFQSSHNQIIAVKLAYLIE
ncbi:MAG: PorT family protein [Dysgonamonadaceae bacterium]|nr:PorT family protein [Dysgonamonadaceae bacterium]